MRLIAFSLTTPQVRAQTKTVTRRLHWEFAKVGDRLRAVVKAMGRKPGEPLVDLGTIEIVDVRREQLDTITREDCAREGFPEMTPAQFVRFFQRNHDKGLGIDAYAVVTRIEFRYISPAAPAASTTTAPMKKTAMKKPKILKVVRTDAFVKVRYETERKSEQTTANDPEKPGQSKTKTVTSFEEMELTAHEQPLEAFDTALQDLAAVAAKVLDAPPEWKNGISVVSVAISYTESNIRSAVISFVKNLNATASLHPIKTPAFQIDDGKQGEGRRQCTPGHADKVIEFIKQAQRYAAGERSQTLLKFQDDEGGEGEADDKQAGLALMEGGKDA